MSVRDLDRLIERLDGCKPRSWTDLWLAGAGVGASLAIAAFVGVLTLPLTPSATRDILWILTVTGIVILILCLAAYLSQRSRYEAEISELEKDLKLYRDRARTA